MDTEVEDADGGLAGEAGGAEAALNSSSKRNCNFLMRGHISSLVSASSS